MAIARHKTRQRELREGRALSRRAQRGDRRAFELLYASYESRLYRFCHRLTGSEIAAAALVEATFARALANLPARGVPIDVAAHLYATARVLAYQSHTNGGPPRADAGGGEHAREVRAANRRLAPRQRMVLALRDLEGRSDEEIARTLGTGVPAVAALVARARLRLRVELRLPAAFGSCAAALPGLSAYADGTLPFAERPQLESHVAGCAHCRAALFALEEAAQRYRALPVPLPPGELSTRMAAALDAVGLAELRPPAAAGAAESSGAPGGRQTAAAAAMAALVVVGAGVTILASSDGRETGEPARAPAPPPPQQQSSGEAITRSSLAANVPRTTPSQRVPPALHHVRAGQRRVVLKRTQSVAQAAASANAKPRAVSPPAPPAPASPPAPAPPPAPIVKETPRKIPVEILPPVAPPHTPATADAPPPPPEPSPPAETTPA
jgi:DNA-directed RNA polymerase specialized sigma24 family protein